MLISCEQDVTLEFEHEPKLCLNCVLNPDSIITANLTLSHALDNSDVFENVDNATIKLFENDSLKGVLSFKGNGTYILKQRPVMGSNYKIVAEAPGYNKVFAATTVPYKPLIAYVKDTTGFMENLNWPVIDLDVKLTDLPGKNSYWLYKTYMVNGAKYGGGTQEINAPYVDNFNRYIDSDSKYGFSHFLQIRMTDEGYDGQVWDFIIPDFIIRGEYLAQHFLSADVHYDKYIKTTLISRMNEDDDLPFYEPVQIYSNIENGYGIFGSCAITTVKL